MSVVTATTTDDSLFCSLSVLIETVSRKPIPPHVKDVVFEMMVNDEEGEDVEVSAALRHLPCFRQKHRLTIAFALTAGAVP